MNIFHRIVLQWHIYFAHRYHVPVHRKPEFHFQIEFYSCMDFQSVKRVGLPCYKTAHQWRILLQQRLWVGRREVRFQVHSREEHSHKYLIFIIRSQLWTVFGERVLQTTGCRQRLMRHWNKKFSREDSYYRWRISKVLQRGRIWTYAN